MNLTHELETHKCIIISFYIREVEQVFDNSVGDYFLYYVVTSHRARYSDIEDVGKKRLEAFLITVYLSFQAHGIFTRRS